jgi:hypothetical protein
MRIASSRVDRLLLVLCVGLFLGSVGALPGQSAASATLRRAAALRLYGVEIGGPEDGFDLTNRAHFVSAQRTEANFLDLRPIWSVLEPSPNEYDWSSLDAGLRNAAAVGLPVTITMRFFDRQVPAWLTAENMRDQEGRTHFGYSGFESRCPSYWGPQARASYLRLIAAMVQRYRANRAILAWQFFYGYNDSFYLGMWQNRETVYDYSSFSQAKFRQYLAEVKQLSLRQLGRRYGTSYRSWEEVSQPKPTFGVFNVSRAWHDFQDYRMWSIERMFDDMFSTVRRLDDRPLIMYYGGSLHHAAHQLSVYDIGLRLLRKHGGALDVTCFEDPVPAEIGAGIVRSYGVPRMAEAWQVPPPALDFRRLFFHAFAHGVRAYQLVGNWERMAPTPEAANMGGARREPPVGDGQKRAPSREEFVWMRRVFRELAETEPVRVPVAGLVPYRSILAHVPARHYINPTLALIPVLQAHQYSLDWHSDQSRLADLDRYPALLDANSEVLERRVLERLEAYVRKGGRLALLPRSGRYLLEEGRPDYPLLRRLGCPAPAQGTIQTWSYGKGQVIRVSAELDWPSPEGTQTLLKLMEGLRVERPVTATPGLLAAVNRGRGGQFYVTLFRPKAEPGSGTWQLRAGLLAPGKRYRIVNLFAEQTEPLVAESGQLERGFPASLTAGELKVLRLAPD